MADRPDGTGTVPAEGVVGDGTTATGRALDRWRRWRLPALLAALLVGAAVLTVLVAGPVGGGVLDPDSAEPTGSRAVANVLRQQGVEVIRHQRVEPALDDAGRGTTLLVIDSPLLGKEQLEALADSGSDLVLVEPDADVLAALAPQLEPADAEPETVADAVCDDPDAQAAGRVTAGGTTVLPAGDAATVCFPADDDTTGSVRPGSYAVTSAGDHLVRVLGQPAVLHNRSVDDHGNAALALRALGRHPRLVWLMADPLDSGTGQPAAGDLLPRWVPWFALHCLLVVLLLALWQGRRLGPLVTEPLPVVVRSAETSEGRANLYRRAGAHDRAGQVLRAATLRRCAARLGLAVSTPAEQVAVAVAQATGADPRTVSAVLTGETVTTAADLVRLAEALDAVEARLSASGADPTGYDTTTDEAPDVPESETP